MEALDIFAGIAAAVITANIGPENECATLALAVKKLKPEIPLIFLSPIGLMKCDFADHILSTYEPEQLR